MSEEYLWDRSGPVDPDVEELERVLAPLGYRHWERRPVRRVWWGVAVAAAAAVLLAAVLVTKTPGRPATKWQVATMRGPSSMGGKAVAVSTALRAGALVQTGTGSELTVQSDEIGKIDVGPDSGLRASSGNKLLLERGRIHAFIWAPPREFVVDTPSARAVDLGCEYTLQVDAAGNGRLHVERGWVAFQFDDIESFIPAGAECRTRKREGPGIPFYADAPVGLRDSVWAFEDGEAGALARILAAARPQDGLTLWHLLTRVRGQERGLVFDRFAQMVKMPAEVTRAAVMQSDRHALDLCWNALHLEDTEWWRGWERHWN